MFSYFYEVLAWKKESYILLPFWPLMITMTALICCYIEIGYILKEVSGVALSATEYTALCTFLSFFLLCILNYVRDLNKGRYLDNRKKTKIAVVYFVVVCSVVAISVLSGLFFIERKNAFFFTVCFCAVPVLFANPAAVLKNYSNFLLSLHAKHADIEPTNILKQLMFYMVSIAILCVGLFKRDMAVECIASKFGIGSDVVMRDYDFEHLRCSRLTALLPFFRRYRAPVLLAKLNNMPIWRAKRICVVN